MTTKVRLLTISTLLFILTYSCNSTQDNFIIQTDNEIDTVDGKPEIVSQTVKTLRKSDSLPVAVLSRLSKYRNDTRLTYLTGHSKDDGLQDYSMDSIFYDNFGNDTLKKSFVTISDGWQPTQVFYKKFRPDRQVNYFMTERPFKKDHYYKREIYYSYNSFGKILNETEVECRRLNSCDSLLKTIYFYDSTGRLDSSVLLIWRDKTWTSSRKKNGR